MIIEQWTTLSQRFPIMMGVGVFILGSFIGSFLNVCIYRVPRGQSIVRPRSHCTQCGAVIRWYDNIPILSWFLLRGKCRYCRQPFSFRYAFIELLVGGLFLASWYQLPAIPALCGMIFISFLVGAAFIDLDHFLLPDSFTLGGTVVGVLLSVLFPQLHGYGYGHYAFVEAIKSFVSSGVGVLVGSAVILWIMIFAEKLLKKEAMGFGDVTLMGCIGAFCGWQGAFFALFGGALLSLIGLAVLIPLERLFGFHWGPRMTGEQVAQIGKESPIDVSTETDQTVNLGVGVAIPFGPWLVLGALIYYLSAHTGIDSYFTQVQTTLYRGFYVW